MGAQNKILLPFYPLIILLGVFLSSPSIPMFYECSMRCHLPRLQDKGHNELQDTGAALVKRHDGLQDTFAALKRLTRQLGIMICLM